VASEPKGPLRAALKFAGDIALLSRKAVEDIDITYKPA
jgi:hypothetical protein